MTPFEQLTTRILNAEKKVATLDEELGIAKTQLREAQDRLVEAMESGAVPTEFAHAGYKWKLEAKTLVQPAPGMQADVVNWIIENGGEDLVKPSVHPQSRDSFLREHLIRPDGTVNIPLELEGLVREYVKTTPRKRKA